MLRMILIDEKTMTYGKIACLGPAVLHCYVVAAWQDKQTIKRCGLLATHATLPITFHNKIFYTNNIYMCSFFMHASCIPEFLPQRVAGAADINGFL